MYKRAQGISINVIIIAAVALLVLVILSVVFMGRMGTFTKTSGGTDYCRNTLGGDCSGTATCEEGLQKVGVCDDNDACCKELKGMIGEGEEEEE